MIGALALLAAAAGPAGTERVAAGRFEVAMHATSAADAAVATATMRKTFHGGLEGTSTGEMLSVGDPASGSAGYVAMERVTGTLDGRAGSFALQQRGVLTQGRPEMSVTVVPGSGTGALAGLAGAMEIDPAHGHAYRFRYTLP